MYFAGSVRAAPPTQTDPSRCRTRRCIRRRRLPRHRPAPPATLRRAAGTPVRGEHRERGSLAEEHSLPWVEEDHVLVEHVAEGREQPLRGRTANALSAACKAARSSRRSRCASGLALHVRARRSPSIALGRLLLSRAEQVVSGPYGEDQAPADAMRGRRRHGVQRCRRCQAAIGMRRPTAITVR